RPSTYPLVPTTGSAARARPVPVSAKRLSHKSSLHARGQSPGRGRVSLATRKEEGPAGAPGGTPAVGRAQLLVVATALVVALIVVVVSLVVVALGRGGRGASAEVQAERDLAADDRRGQRQPGRKRQRERLPVHRDRDGPRAHARHRGLDRD